VSNSIVIIGAGSYGLPVAAHLSVRGIMPVPGAPRLALG
jgi:glycine/D-amino acid oxidase-like deaminating enzyme